MARVWRGMAGMVAGIFFVCAGSAAGQAAGAMAVGACAAYGYAFDYGNVRAARAAAEGKCAGAQCEVVVTLSHSCAAFAIDGHSPCGPQGYASAPGLGEAENTALESCHKFGGRDCVIRAFACDRKG
jgi:hypothetical protein